MGAFAAPRHISRTTLYRRADLRAIVEEHRAHGRDATTLTGLAVQIDQLRRRSALVTVIVTKTRRNEPDMVLGSADDPDDGCTKPWLELGKQGVHGEAACI